MLAIRRACRCQGTPCSRMQGEWHGDVCARGACGLAFARSRDDQVRRVLRQVDQYGNHERSDRECRRDIEDAEIARVAFPQRVCGWTSPCGVPGYGGLARSCELSRASLPRNLVRRPQRAMSLCGAWRRSVLVTFLRLPPSGITTDVGRARVRLSTHYRIHQNDVGARFLRRAPLVPGWAAHGVKDQRRAAQ